MMAAIKEAVSEYCSIFRRSNLPDLRLSGLYDLFPEEAQAAQVDSAWPSKWPHADEAGVYFIFGLSGQILYIGKASMSCCIGVRLSNYFGTDRATGRCLVRYD